LFIISATGIPPVIANDYFNSISSSIIASAAKAAGGTK
jgi:hypothetical protein